MTTAEAATSGALLEMEGQMLASRSSWGRECRRRSSVLPLNLSDTASTSQDGSSLKFIPAIVGRQSFIQDASGRGLCGTVVEANSSFVYLC